ncbi:hypothetical protein Tco_0232814 [Tanacetum coccineum]
MDRLKIKEDEAKKKFQEEDKDEERTRKRKIGTRKKMKSRKRRYIQNTSEDDSDKENDELRLHLTIAQDEEKEVDYEILDKKIQSKKEDRLEVSGRRSSFRVLDDKDCPYLIRRSKCVYQLMMKMSFGMHNNDRKIVELEVSDGSLGVHVLVTDTDSEFMLWNSLLLLECSSSSYFAAVSILKLTLPTGRYVVPTGRVIATDSVIVATSGYVVPAAYDISPGRVK